MTTRGTPGPTCGARRRGVCGYHEAVIASLTQKDHVADRESERVAAQIARQCPACRSNP